MTTALHAVALIAGVLIVIATVLSAIKATILPRGARSQITRSVSGTVRAGFRVWTSRSASYERRDRAMAMLGPISLMTLLATWLVLIIGGYCLIYLAITGRSLERSVELSGASIFTLGTTADARLVPSLVTYSEAGIGLLVVTLLITYLPSIYTAFSRRENGVALLQVRAGDPPQAATMLIRFHRIEQARFRLTELWRQWEAWFADIEESHATFPVLVFFRSPHPRRSWITAAGAVLDGASFWAAAVEHPNDPDVQLCLRAGTLALRQIADIFRLTYDPDPEPGGPISVSRQEWDGAMAEMEAAGIPLKADREKAWQAWRGWRVNYDTVLLDLARLVEAPLTPWVSDRTPVRVDDVARRGANRRRVPGRFKIGGRS